MEGRGASQGKQPERSRDLFLRMFPEQNYRTTNVIVKVFNLCRLFHDTFKVKVMDILELLKFLFIILLPTQSHGLTQLLQKCLQAGNRPDGCS